MNQIICDICGSSYPEDAERCPVCSYPRQGNEKTVAAAAVATQDHVKGGRFSSKNVKKRQKQQRRAQERAGKDPNKPLIITIVLLLIAIVLVAAFIVIRYFRMGFDWPWNAATEPAETTAPVVTAPVEIPCAGLNLDESPLVLNALGEQAQLEIQVQPADTTDALRFVSDDPSIAEVTETGLVTVTGYGKTQITVTCGAFSKQIEVFCWIETEPVETETTEPKELTLTSTDVTCTKFHQTFSLYVKLGSKDISRSKITWSTSDPAVATVDNGTVTSVGKGMATITAEYDGQKAYCTVRCRFENETKPAVSDWRVRPSDDVRIVVGETFRLRVKNSAGEEADVIWTMNKEGIISIEGNKVTGRATGTVKLKTEIDGVTLTCTVRVF